MALSVGDSVSRFCMKCLKPLRPLGPLNRPALGVILSRDARFGQGVEQGGLANVGQAHDAAFQTHIDILR